MPSTSGKQHRFFEWISHTPGASAESGVSKSVADDFVQADKGRHFSKADGGPVDLSYSPNQNPSQFRRPLLSATVPNRRGPEEEGDVTAQGQLGGPGKTNELNVTYRKNIPFARGGAIDLAGKAYSLARRMAREQMGVDKIKDKLEEHFDTGGMPEAPFFERSELRQLQYGNEHPGGLVNAGGPGRTDLYNVGVRSGSYVIPSDVVAGLGESNTLAGSGVIDKMLHTMPYGIQAPQSRRGGMGIPHPPRPFEDPGIQSVWPKSNVVASGGHIGTASGKDDIIPVKVAGGEYILNPEQVMAFTGSPTMDHAHQTLDKFCLNVRKRAIKETRSLPPPKKSHES